MSVPGPITNRVQMPIESKTRKKKNLWFGDCEIAHSDFNIFYMCCVIPYSQNLKYKLIIL